MKIIVSQMNKEQLVEIVKQVPARASAENWVMTLDHEEGTLFYSPRVIPEGSQLFQVTDEYSIYVDAARRPHGVMVEYYNHNFIQHHPEFKIMAPKVFDSDGSDDVVVSVSESKNEDAAVFKALFEMTLIAEAVAGHDSHDRT